MTVMEAEVGVDWKLTDPALIEAFKRDWALPMPLKEMAALYEFKNINSVSRQAQRLGLPKRAGGPRKGKKNRSPEVLKGGHWQGKAGIVVWKKDS